jgi:predicted transcriptional regulator
MPKVLAPRRLEVINVVHAIGLLSVRTLARTMKRDYQNLHHDVQILSGPAFLCGQAMAD